MIADALWVIDENQPVAAVLDPHTMAVRQIVDWRTVEPSAPDSQIMMAADSTQLWLQLNVDSGTPGALIRVDTTRVEQIAYPDGALVMAAGHEAVWLVISEGPLEPRYPTPEGEYLPTLPMPGCLLVVIDSDGQRTIPVDRPITRVVTAPEGIYLQAHRELPAAVPFGDSGKAWQYDYFREWLLLPDPLPKRIEFDHCVKREPGEHATPHGFGGCGPRLSWYTRTASWSAAGLRWALGPLPERAHGDRHPMIATGHHPGTGEELRRFELGYGRMYAVCATEGFLWVVLCRAPRPRIDQPVELVRVNAFTGAMNTVGEIDITEWCLPIIELSSADVNAHVRKELDSAKALEQLSCLTDVRCSVEGNWPRMYLRAWFRNSYFPDGWMTRRWPLFDEFGRPRSYFHKEVYLMEDVECRLLPPVDTANAGVLEV